MRTEAILPLHHVFSAGPVSRGEFAQMTGLGERSARYLLSALLREEILTSKGPRSEVEFNLPLKHLHFLMPNLYPEASMRDGDAGERDDAEQAHEESGRPRNRP